MSIARRPSHERLRTRIGWLDSRHSFSFGEHYDPRYMGYRALRVINEDRVAPGMGFGTHSHRDMEIVSYTHQDADLYSGLFSSGDRVTHPFKPERHGWVQVARGAIQLNGAPRDAGDGAAVTEESAVEVVALADSEVLLLDLA